MKIWKLTIKDNEGYVRIRAKTEDRAREVAYEMFSSSNAHKMVHASDWSKVAWTDKTQVHCELEDEDISNAEGLLDIV
ncbi:MAG: hypothetical protein AB7V32_05510 [Candidatus Berkiella sp.]